MAHLTAVEEPPYGISSGKLAMWLFIMSDAATFAVLLLAYGFLRVSSPDWTRPFAFSPTIVNALVMTVVLLASSLTMAGGGAAAAAGRTADGVRWLVATMSLGVLFAALHLREWRALSAEGWGLARNPLGGTPAVGATVFGITGLSLLHVVVGVIAIGVIALQYRRGRFTAAHVENVGLYWHFVNVTWMFVFPLVYLLNIR